jgi:hypothetical protein
MTAKTAQMKRTDKELGRAMRRYQAAKAKPSGTRKRSHPRRQPDIKLSEDGCEPGWASVEACANADTLSVGTGFNAEAGIVIHLELAINFGCPAAH